MRRNRPNVEIRLCSGRMGLVILPQHRASVRSFAETPGSQPCNSDPAARPSLSGGPRWAARK